MIEYGFKKLTLDNWLKQDEVLSYFASLQADGTITSISNEEWVADILRPELDDSVPLSIRRLYEVARGAMAYGCFFYPLFALAAEQLYRVAETAVKERCRKPDIAKEARSFKKGIDLLVKHEAIGETVYGIWNSIRCLRNWASHPGDQQIQTPGSAVGQLWRMAERINALFGGDPSNVSPRSGSSEP